MRRFQARTTDVTDQYHLPLTLREIKRTRGVVGIDYQRRESNEIPAVYLNHAGE